LVDTAGLKTLELRTEKHVKNASRIAEILAASPKVKKVYYLALLKSEHGKIGTLRHIAHRGVGSNKD
jgi:cystathionine beta-lyase/cystathionine gamma-synthase